MLSTSDIINLYNNQEYDIIIDNLKLLNFNQSKPQLILSYAISTSNIELFTCALTVDNVKAHLDNIVKKPLLHTSFANLLENNFALCNKIKELINENIFMNIFNDMAFFNIILKYIPDINCYNLKLYLTKAIFSNNLNMIDNLFEYGLNMISTVDKIFKEPIYSYCNKIDISTLICLEKYDINLSAYINNISLTYCFHSDIDGIIFCLSYGADINIILRKLVSNPKIQLDCIKYIINNGGDLNCLNSDDIIWISDINIIICLVDNGLDILPYVDKLILCAILRHNLSLLQYYCVNFSVDIHIYDGLFLFFAVKYGGIESVKLLLDLGADIHANDNRILAFSKKELYPSTRTHFHGSGLYNKIPNMFVYSELSGKSPTDKLDMFKYLIKNGAVITDPVIIMQHYLRYPDALIDDDLLVYFLDAGWDLNCKHNLYRGEYILEYIIYSGNSDMVKLFLKYGADVRNNNYGAIKIAIKLDEPEIISLLLTTIDITPLVNTLLEQYDPDKKKLIY